MKKKSTKKTKVLRRKTTKSTRTKRKMRKKLQEREKAQNHLLHRHQSEQLERKRRETKMLSDMIGWRPYAMKKVLLKTTLTIMATRFSFQHLPTLRSHHSKNNIGISKRSNGILLSFSKKYV
jgi:hypothetical protein